MNLKTIKQFYQAHSRQALASLEGLIASRQFLLFSYGWFIAQATYMMLATKYRVAPDAFYHYSYIKLYAGDGLDPFIQNQEGFYFLGPVAREPRYLYHYLMSFVERLSPFSEAGTILLIQIISILTVLVGLVVFVKLMRRLQMPEVIIGLSLFMLVNTLMFTFIAGAVNYDGVFFMLSVMSVYLLLKLLQDKRLKTLLQLGSIMLIATLVKFSFAPLMALITVVALLAAWPNRHRFRQQFHQDLKVQRMALVFLLVPLILLSGLFIERYGGNLWRYRAIVPKCPQVLTIEQCNQSALYQRNRKFAETTPAAVSRIPPFDFVVRWSQRMRVGTYGILAFQPFDSSQFIANGTKLLIILMIVAAIRSIRWRDEKLLFYVVAIAVTYVGILVYVNYGTFLRSGQFGIALQGRYAFPVLGLLYMAGNFYIWRSLGNYRTAKISYILFVLLLFFVAGLPAYIYGTGTDWHTESISGLNQILSGWLHGFGPTDYLLR